MERSWWSEEAEEGRREMGRVEEAVGLGRLVYVDGSYWLMRRRSHLPVVVFVDWVSSLSSHPTLLFPFFSIIDFFFFP